MTEPRTTRSPNLYWTIVPLVCAAAIVWVGVVWGRAEQQRHPGIKLGAAPLVGRWDLRLGVGIVPAVIAAAAIVVWGPTVMGRGTYRQSVALAACSSVVFVFALAASDGLGRVLDPVVHPTEYWSNLPKMGSITNLLKNYTDLRFQDRMSTHIKGHPPGMVVVLKWLSTIRVGPIDLGAPWATGALSYLGVAVLVWGVMATVRAATDDETARQLGPWLALAPYAMWLGTSADAFFTGLTALGSAVLLRAAVAHGRAQAALTGVAAGAILGFALHTTYTVALVLAIPGSVLLWLVVSRRTTAAMAISAGLGAVGGATAVTAAFMTKGYSWFEGVQTTRIYYRLGSSQYRTWTYFLVANVAALLIAIGPATIIGVSELLGRRTGRLADRSVGPRSTTGLAVIVAAALVCVMVAEASQYTKGEVERIWLLFMPWLVPAGLTLRRHSRWWLASQAVLAIGLQVSLVSKW